MSKGKIVIALGHKALGTTLPEQMEAVKFSAKAVADFTAAGYQVAITHSNAPQIGMIHAAMNEFGKTHDAYTQAPMSVCSAMSQGYIGYDLQSAIRGELLQRGVARTVSTVLTQVKVDPYDDAFYHPVKVIGRVLSKDEADAEERRGNYVTEIPGEGYKRIVAAPKPVEIIEKEAIQALYSAGQVVIAGGGGGIPVLEQGYQLKGASAVIEKDLLAGLLAKDLDADYLFILTGVDKVCLNYGKENETPIDEMDIQQAKAYIKEGHFAPNTMLPKIESSIDFISARENGKVIIASIDKAVDALKGKTGTVIHK